MNMTYNEIRKTLMSATIRVVAKYGMQGATTRNIGDESNLNGANIYRYFADKEDLLRQTYIAENTKLIMTVVKGIRAEAEKELDPITLGKNVWMTLFDYLMANPDTCVFCRYYYNSPGVLTDAAENHEELRERLKLEMYPYFPKNAKIDLFVYSIIDTALCAAMQLIRFGKDIHADKETVCEFYLTQLKSAYQYIYNEAEQSIQK